MPRFIDFLGLLSLTIRLTSAVQCECKGYSSYEGCDVNGVCSGTYCITAWVVSGGEILYKNCLTTISDISEQKCETNRKGQVSCICTTEKCNDASFNIPSDVPLVAPPTIKCHQKGTGEDDFCFGHICSYTAYMDSNEFGDDWPSKDTSPTRGCSDSLYNVDYSSINMCYLSDSQIVCRCNTEFCNKEQPFKVPKGDIACYLEDTLAPSSEYGQKYCRGHLCYYQNLDGNIKRGCYSLSENVPDTLRTSGRTYYSNICTEDLCNGDFEDGAPNQSIDSNSTTSLR